MRLPLTLALGLLLSLDALADDIAPTPPMDEIPTRPNIRGAFRTIGEVEFLRYGRTADIDRVGTDTAGNLIQYASLQATGLGDPRLSAVASGRYEWNAAPSSYSELRDLSDAEPLRRHFKLFEAYGEARDLAEGHVTVRAGRQNIMGFEPVSLDGGRVDVDRVSIFRATAYGGMRASVYSGSDDNPVFGGEVGARPAPWLDLVAGAFHYVADALGAEAREAPLKDLSFVQRVEAIGGKLSEATFTGRGRCPLGLELRLGYTRWFATERFPYDYTFERDKEKGVTRLLVGSRTDGNEGSAELIYDAVPHLVLSLGGRIFRPTSGDLDPYNLPYEEVSPGVEVLDLPWRGLDASVHYRVYRAETGPSPTIDPTTVAGFTDLRGEGVSRWDEVSLDLAQRLGNAVRTSVGGIFRREDYEDRFGKIAGAKAWDAYAEARWLVTASWTFRVRYDYAQDFDLIAPQVAWDQRVLIEVRYAF
jgi:hypothetical protein